MSREVSFTIDKELAEKFDHAIILKKDEPNKIISKFITRYVSESLSDVDRDVDILPTNQSNYIGRSSSKKITKDMIETAYIYAKKVYMGELSRIEGKVEVSETTGMNVGSAQDYITDFLAMMEGKEYHRTMSNIGTEYFLMQIRNDFGQEAFERAIYATEQHIKYYNSLGYGQLKEKEKLVKRLKESKGIPI